VGRGRLELPHPFGGDFTDPDHRFVFEMARADRKRNGLKTVRAELETVLEAYQGRVIVDQWPR